MKFEMLGASQFKIIIFKKIEPSADYNIIWSFVLEASFPVASSTENISLEKTLVFKKKPRLIDMVN